MQSDRLQRQIDRLLDEADDGIRGLDWPTVRDRAEAVLALQRDNTDALAYLKAAQDKLSTSPAPRATVAAPTPGALAVPTSFSAGRYQVKRSLGEGGKKRVFLAHDTKLDRDVAFALIKTEGLDQEGLLRIAREAQAMAQLGDHPHIVSVYDIGEEDGQPYLVTQLMGGGDVEELIKRAPEHRVPLTQALAIAEQVCQALDHAHSRGIVHRDLKPGNVWLTAEGNAELGDFGLAIALEKTRLTQAGMMVGTVGYMPPEQAMGGEVTPQSDLYSLGAMLYELVTGRPPFVGEESVAIITQHLNTPPIAPSWHRPDLPPSLEVLILRLLEKDAARRPSSAAEVRAALAGVNLWPSPSPAGEGEPGFPAPPLRAGEGDGGRGLPGVGGAGENPLYRRTFVGRESELLQLQAAFDAACSGQGGLAMVVGEPGIGKTALCEQLATYAAIRGGKALVGHCYEEGSLSLAYLPFVEAIRGYVLTRAPEELRAELGSGASDVARIVSEIREKVAVEPRGAGDPEDDRWRLYQAVTGFLRNAAGVQPLVLVLEDLHWADRSTLDFLVHLARNLVGARLLFVGTYRDVEVDRAHPLSPALAELRRGSAFSRMALRGLTPDEVHRMLNNLTAQEVRWGLAEAVHRQTEGNPLFIQEVLRYLVEEGLITHEGGRWHRAGEAALELSIPEGLRDVIGKRLSRLSAECNRVLAIAAVIGRDFDLETLRRVAETDEEALVQALEEARHVGVLEEQAARGVVRYRFAHAFFRQTLYEEMSGPRRLRWHQGVARALEAQYANRLDEHAAEMAEHFAQATDSEGLAKAVHYSQMAAQRAASVYAYGEVVRLLEQAVEVQEILDPDDRARRCDLLLALGDVLPPAGEPLRAAREVAPEAFGLAEAMGDATRATRVCLEALRTYSLAASMGTSEGLEWLERAERYVPPDTVEHVRVGLNRVTALRFAGRLREGHARVLEALDLAERLGDLETTIVAAQEAMVQDWLPEHQIDRFRIAERSMAWSRQSMPAGRLARLLQFMIHSRLSWGDRPGAEATLREVDELAARTRHPAARGTSDLGKRMLAIVDGNLEEAVALGARRAAESEAAGLPGRVGGLLAALLYLGRATEAFAFAERGIGSSDFDERGVNAAHRAVLLAHLGRGEEAREALTSCLEEWSFHGDGDEIRTDVLAQLLEAAVLVGDRERAPMLAARVLDLGSVEFVESTRPTNVPRHLGGAAALMGDAGQARRYYGQSLAICHKLRFRPEIALTRLQLAELLLEEYPDERAEAIAHLDFAIEEFRAMKMQPSLERALRHKGLLHA